MPTPCRMTPGPGCPRDQGGIVLGWLARLVVVIAAAGLLAFDAVSVGVTRLAVADAARTVASRAAGAWGESHERRRAYEAALAAARASDPTAQVPPDRFRIDPDGAVHLELRRTAHTVVLGHVPALRRWVDVGASGSAPPAS